VVLPDGIPIDTIKTILGKDFDEVWASLKLILEEKNQCYSIGWLAKSITKRKEFCEKQADKVKKRWNNHGNTTVYTTVIPSEDEDENVIEVTNGIELIAEKRIEDLYNAYPKKVAKVRAFKAIKAALKKVGYNELLVSVVKYSESVAGKERKYIPNPASWFNDERWLDELEKSESDTIKNTAMEMLNEHYNGESGVSGFLIGNINDAKGLAFNS
jgi:hypothetical protein